MKLSFSILTVLSCVLSLCYGADNAGAKRTSHRGAGVLPYCYQDGQLYFLLSKEGYGFSANTWCDFGGSKDGAEMAFQTAARECWEESRGILGTESAIAEQISSKQPIGKTYALFFLKVPDPSSITNEAFLKRRFFSFCRMEKTAIAWVKAKAVYEAAFNKAPLTLPNGNQITLRPFFGRVLEEARKNEVHSRALDSL